MKEFIINEILKIFNDEAIFRYVKSIDDYLIINKLLSEKQAKIICVALH